VAVLGLVACSRAPTPSVQLPPPADYGCDAPFDTFVQAAAAAGLGGDDLLATLVDFMASTRDGGLVGTGLVDRKVDGTMAVQSRDCDDASAHPGSCNVTGFDGTLLGWTATPAGALRFDEGRWCADPGTPLSFTGFAAPALIGSGLLVHLVATDDPEPAWDPIASVDAAVFTFDAEVWQVPRDCTLADAPCGGELAATGTFVRTDTLVWSRW
jgi:hypothetical protein